MKLLHFCINIRVCQSTIPNAHAIASIPSQKYLRSVPKGNGTFNARPNEIELNVYSSFPTYISYAYLLVSPSERSLKTVFAVLGSVASSL